VLSGMLNIPAVAAVPPEAEGSVLTTPLVAFAAPLAPGAKVME
jgi:hypothetical protein